MRLRCGVCGKSVSTEVAEDTIVRAWLECPECIIQNIPKMPKAIYSRPANNPKPKIVVKRSYNKKRVMKPEDDISRQISQQIPGNFPK